MGYLSERISYLKGLADGMNLSSETNEGRLLKEILEFLDDLALSVEELEVEVIESLDDLEERYDILEDIITDEFDPLDFFDDEDYDEDEDEECDTIICPACSGLFEFSDEFISEDGDYITCPSCGEEIELEWSFSNCDFCFDEDEDEE